MSHLWVYLFPSTAPPPLTSFLAFKVNLHEKALNWHEQMVSLYRRSKNCSWHNFSLFSNSFMNRFYIIRTWIYSILNNSLFVRLGQDGICINYISYMFEIFIVYWNSFFINPYLHMWIHFEVFYWNDRILLWHRTL